jgi:hypothetical protein
VKKLFLLTSAALAMLAMAACSDAPTAPSARKAAPSASSSDITCQSGYIVAYDQYGNPYCAPESQGASSPLRQP